MPAYLLRGEEDDDFAYEQEHIERESENQEYEDLGEEEFPAAAHTNASEPDEPVRVPKISPPPPDPREEEINPVSIAEAPPEALTQGIGRSKPVRKKVSRQISRKGKAAKRASKKKQAKKTATRKTALKTETAKKAAHKKASRKTAPSKTARETPSKAAARKKSVPKKKRR